MKFKRYNKKSSYSYTFGYSTTQSLLKNKKNINIIKVLIKKEGLKDKEVLNLKQNLEKNKIPYEINNRLIDKISYKENTYVIGIFEKFKEDIDKNKDIIVLVNPSNPRNVGTIIRTMLAFEFKNLLLVKPAVDVFHPSLIRASMGAFFNINFEYIDSVKDLKNIIKNYKNYSLMLDGDKSVNDIKIDRNKKNCFIFGNESRGLDKDFKNFTNTIYIPHSNNIDSLNVSISVGITLFKTKYG